MKQDVGLETLLALDGTEYTEENGYWYKFEVSLGCVLNQSLLIGQ